MSNYESLQRDLAYYKGIMQSTYGDPNKAGLYREAERQLYNITKLLESSNYSGYHNYNQQPVYNNYQQDNYRQDNYRQVGFSQSNYVNYNTPSTGVDTVNTRYSNKSNNVNTQPVYQEEVKPPVQTTPVEKKPYKGNEFPFVTDEITIAEKSDDSERYVWKFKRLEKDISNCEKEKTFKIGLTDLDNGLENSLLSINRDDIIVGIKNPIEISINKCYVKEENHPNGTSIDINTFKLTEDYDNDLEESITKPINSIITKIYNLTLASYGITISTSDIREDLTELEKLSSTNTIEDLCYAHEEAFNNIDNFINKKLKIETSNVYNNLVVTTNIISPCVLIPTELAIKIKKTNLNGSFVLVNRKSYKDLNNILTDVLLDKDDHDTKEIGIILFKSNTGGIGYFLFSKTEYNSYCIAI